MLFFKFSFSTSISSFAEEVEGFGEYKEDENVVADFGELAFGDTTAVPATGGLEGPILGFIKNKIVSYCLFKMADFEEQVKEIISKQGLEECTTTSIMDEIQLRNNNTSLSGEDQEKIRDLIDDCLIKKMVEDDDRRLAKELQTSINPGSRRESMTRKAKKTKKIEKQTKKRAPSVNNPFNRPMILSSPLATLVNIDNKTKGGGGDDDDGSRVTITELSRPQVVKSIWSYVKERNLQDSSNKKILLCDSVMKDIFRKDRIDCFEMNKILSSHLTRTEDLVSTEVLVKHNVPSCLKKYLFPSSTRSTFTYEEIEAVFIEKIKEMALIDRPGYLEVDGELKECIGRSSKKLSLEEPVHLIQLMNWLRVVLKM